MPRMSMCLVTHEISIWHPSRLTLKQNLFMPFKNNSYGLLSAASPGLQYTIVSYTARVYKYTWNNNVDTICMATHTD